MPRSEFLPPTNARVRSHSPGSANARIRAAMLSRLEVYEHANADRISARIAELEREWDIERVLEANAASVALLGLTLGATINRRWFALPAVVAGFLLQHAVQGWCPPLPVFRRLGIRTASEIHEEITALKILRGDFGEGGRSAADAARLARLH